VSRQLRLRNEAPNGSRQPASVGQASRTGQRDLTAKPSTTPGRLVFTGLFCARPSFPRRSNGRDGKNPLFRKVLPTVKATRQLARCPPTGRRGRVRQLSSAKRKWALGPAGLAWASRKAICKTLALSAVVVRSRRPTPSNITAKPARRSTAPAALSKLPSSPRPPRPVATADSAGGPARRPASRR